ncbi:hypothetical protein HYH03_000818 [Edaphochlamys debaryana]|uniref:Uncharacterized protein n=1 Tax=Edaphochlamys debaryana TaxID=47281 RepID=A0A836C592_9CHLO|nr:hypothetical protein HYH03_000818 [Edaphochlamys debaryana]|eukprot:KAG2500996.1 hypothetical protein HYH03_000818 [Edaphochlamys debaryana]
MSEGAASFPHKEVAGPGQDAGSTAGSATGEGRGRRSFSESLLSKLPVPRFAFVEGPLNRTGSAASREPSSPGTQDGLPSGASTAQRSPSATGVTPTTAAAASEAEQKLLESLHVKFSASTRFNSTTDRPGAAPAGSAHPSGIPRSGTMSKGAGTLLRQATGRGSRDTGSPARAFGRGPGASGGGGRGGGGRGGGGEAASPRSGLGREDTGPRPGPRPRVSVGFADEPMGDAAGGGGPPGFGAGRGAPGEGGRAGEGGAGGGASPRVGLGVSSSMPLRSALKRSSQPAPPPQPPFGPPPGSRSMRRSGSEAAEAGRGGGRRRQRLSSQGQTPSILSMAFGRSRSRRSSVTESEGPGPGPGLGPSRSLSRSRSRGRSSVEEGEPGMDRALSRSRSRGRGGSPGGGLVSLLSSVFGAEGSRSSRLRGRTRMPEEPYDGLGPGRPGRGRSMSRSMSRSRSRSRGATPGDEGLERTSSARQQRPKSPLSGLANFITSNLSRGSRRRSGTQDEGFMEGGGRPGRPMRRSRSSSPGLGRSSRSRGRDRRASQDASDGPGSGGRGRQGRAMRNLGSMFSFAGRPGRSRSRSGSPGRRESEGGRGRGRSARFSEDRPSGASYGQPSMRSGRPRLTDQSDGGMMLGSPRLSQPGPRQSQRVSRAAYGPPMGPDAYADPREGRPPLRLASGRGSENSLMFLAPGGPMDQATPTLRQFSAGPDGGPPDMWAVEEPRRSPAGRRPPALQLGYGPEAGPTGRPPLPFGPRPSLTGVGGYHRPSSQSGAMAFSSFQGDSSLPSPVMVQSPTFGGPTGRPPPPPSPRGRPPAAPTMQRGPSSRRSPSRSPSRAASKRQLRRSQTAAPRSRAAQKRQDRMEQGGGRGGRRGRSMRRTDSDGDMRKSFAARRRQARSSGAGADPDEQPSREGSPEEGRARGSLFSWLSRGRKTKSQTAPPETAPTPSDTAAGTAASTADAASPGPPTAGTPPVPGAISPVGSVTIAMGAAGASPAAAPGTASSAAPAGTSPVAAPSSRTPSGRRRSLDEVRPAPVIIPPVPAAAGSIQVLGPVGGAAAAAGAGIGSGTGAAGAQAAEEGAGEKAEKKKGAWSKLFNAMKWKSPKKKDDGGDTGAAAALALAQPTAQPSDGPAISSSQLPGPAFPTPPGGPDSALSRLSSRDGVTPQPRPERGPSRLGTSAAGAGDGRTASTATSQPQPPDGAAGKEDGKPGSKDGAQEGSKEGGEGGKARPDSTVPMSSPFQRAAKLLQALDMAPESLTSVDPLAAKQTGRRHGRTKSDIGPGARARPSTAEPQPTAPAFPTFWPFSPPPYKVPYNLPTGRTVSPLGKRMVLAASGAYATGNMAGTWGGSQATTIARGGHAVVMLQPLASSVAGKVFISPLRPSAAAAHVAAAWGVDGQGMRLGYDRLPQFHSVLHPGPATRAISPPGHYPRPPPPHPGLPYSSGGGLLPPTDITTMYDATVFSPSIPTAPMDESGYINSVANRLMATLGSDAPLMGSVAARPGTAVGTTLRSSVGGSAWGNTTHGWGGPDRPRLLGHRHVGDPAPMGSLQQPGLPPRPRGQGPSLSGWGSGAGVGEAAGAAWTALALAAQPQPGPQLPEGHVPVKVLRTPLALGLRDPGAGRLLMQAPEPVRAVAEGEANALVHLEREKQARLEDEAETTLAQLRLAEREPPSQPTVPLLTTAAMRQLPRAMLRGGMVTISGTALAGGGGGYMGGGSMAGGGSPGGAGGGGGYVGRGMAGGGSPGTGGGGGGPMVTWAGGGGTADRSWRGHGDGVMSSVAGPLAGGNLSSPEARVYASSPAPEHLSPSAYRKHRVLGSVPAGENDPYPTLARPDQPPLLGPEPQMPYQVPPPPGTARLSTADILRPRTRAMPQPRASAGPGPGGTYAGPGGTYAGPGGTYAAATAMAAALFGDDDASSIASSMTVDSLRDMPPALARELRRREVLDPSGVGLGAMGGGVSGVTVRPLMREVTAGPHVKLMKPRQLLRTMQPPGTLDAAFTRKEGLTAILTPPYDGRTELPEASGTVPAHATSGSGTQGRTNRPNDATLARPDTSGVRMVTPTRVILASRPHPNAPAGAAPTSPAGGRRDSDLDPEPASRSASRRQTDPEPVSRTASRRQTDPEPASRAASRRQTDQEGGTDSEPPMPEGPRLLRRNTTGLTPREASPGERSPPWQAGDHAGFLRVEDQRVPGVKLLAPPAMSAAARSPPRLLRMPQAPSKRQATRRHVNNGFLAQEEEGPRYRNVKLMRVLGPPNADPQEPEPLPGEGPVVPLPMRKLRVLGRPEADLPGLVPAGTAGRTEHLLDMLRRSPTRLRPGVPVGQRVSIFERPLADGSDGGGGPGYGGSGGGGAGGGRSGGGASGGPSSGSPRTRFPGPGGSSWGRGDSGGGLDGRYSPRSGGGAGGCSSPRYGPGSGADAATQSGPANAPIEIRVTTSPGPAPYPPPPPPYEPYPYAYPYPPPMPPMPTTDPSALAGLAALGQLTALTALQDLGRGWGAPPEDDPTLWAPLMETTPEQLVATQQDPQLQRQQRRGALEQSAAQALHQMDPALVLDPDQMLGPGPLGDAQHALRATGAMGPPAPGPGPGPHWHEPWRAGAPYHEGYSVGPDGTVKGWPGQGQGQGYGYQEGAGGGGGPGSPGRWLQSTGRDGRLVGVGAAAKEGQAEELSREEQRRRRRASRAEAAYDEEDGYGSADGRRDGGRRRHRSKGRSRRRRGSSRCRRRSTSSTGSSSSASDSDSDSDTDRSGSSSNSSSSSSGRGKKHRRKHRKDKKGRGKDKGKKKGSKGRGKGGADAPAEPPAPAAGAAEQAAPLPLYFSATPMRTSPGGAEYVKSPDAPRPEPGDDFGLDVAEKLLRQMEAPLGRPGGSQAGASGAAVESEGEEADAAGPRGKPPLGRRYAGALDRPPPDPRGSSSPNTRMADVLRGPETDRRAQEILARQASLREKFLSAAANLRSEVASAGLGPDAGAGPGPADPLDAIPLPLEPPAPEGGPERAPASASAASASLAPPSERGPGSVAGPGSKAGSVGVPASEAGAAASAEASSAAAVSAATAAASGAQYHQAPPPTAQAQQIQIYCTQLVLNPGRGPVTVPGLPAYYPAPGPAAWAGVPMAHPASPPPYPGPHHHAGSPGWDAYGRPVDPSERAAYVRSGHSPPSGRPGPAVPVAPVATAAWLPPKRGARQSEPSGLASPEQSRGAGGENEAAVGVATEGSTGAEAAPQLPSPLSKSLRKPGQLTQRVIARGRSFAATGRSGRASDGSGGGGAGEAEEGGMMRLGTGVALPPPRTGRWSGSGSGGPASVAESESLQGSDTRSHGDSDPEASGSEGGGRDREGSTAAPAGSVRAGSVQAGSVRAGSVRAGSDRRSEPGGGGGSRRASDAGSARPPPGPSPPAAAAATGSPAKPKEALAAELTQLIMEAFQQSGGVINPIPSAAARVSGGGAEPTDDEFLAAAEASAAAAIAAAGIHDAARRNATLDPAVTSAAAATAAAAGPPTLPATLPNAAVPRGKGPCFLQISEIELTAPPDGPPADGTGAAAASAAMSYAAEPDPFTAQIMAGLHDWETEVASALSGRPLVPALPSGAAAFFPPGAHPHHPHPRTSFGAVGTGSGYGGGTFVGTGYVSTGFHTASQGEPGRSLTASEALVIDPSYAQRHQQETISARRSLREAAIVERKLRYQAGLRNFADGDQPLRPLFLPPPQFQGPLPPAHGLLDAQGLPVGGGGGTFGGGGGGGSFGPGMAGDEFILPMPPPTMTLPQGTAALPPGGGGGVPPPSVFVAPVGGGPNAGVAAPYYLTEAFADGSITLSPGPPGAGAAAGGPGGGGGGPTLQGWQPLQPAASRHPSTGQQQRPSAARKLGWSDDTHGSMFGAAAEAGPNGGGWGGAAAAVAAAAAGPSLSGPGVERRPHAASPLQRRMHGELDPRKRQLGRASMSPRAQAMFDHQRAFTAKNATSALRPARRSGGAGASTRRSGAGGGGGPSVKFAAGTHGLSPEGVAATRPGAAAASDATTSGYRVPYMARTSPEASAVRSLAAMVAQRIEGGPDGTALYGSTMYGEVEYGADENGGDWGGDADELMEGTECGGCNWIGCPVHGDPAAWEANKAAEEQRRAEIEARGLASTVGGSAGGGAEYGAWARPGGSMSQAAASVGSGPGPGAGPITGAAAAAADPDAAARAAREMNRAVLLDRWMAEMKDLQAAAARAEATTRVAAASTQQAMALRRERQAEELQGIFSMLGEVDALAATMMGDAERTKKMMMALEEDSDLRQAARLNELLFEAQRLTSQVDAALDGATPRGATPREAGAGPAASAAPSPGPGP